MNHPMANNYIYYNNQLKGAKVIMNSFNGFQELKRREDAAEKILNFYECLSLKENGAEKINPYTKYRINRTYFKVGFVELVIASMNIPDLYSSTNIDRLERISNLKYEEKINNKNYNNVYTFSHSLMIAAQVKMKKTGKTDTRLKRFIEKGGDVHSSKEITEISRIIYTK